jgi:hypothetical protein
MNQFHPFSLNLLKEYERKGQKSSELIDLDAIRLREMDVSGQVG